MVIHYSYNSVNLLSLSLILPQLLSAISASYGGRTTSYFTTNKSESDQRDKPVGKKRELSNAYGRCKTSRYNRPHHDKKILEQCEKIATRCSSRIKQLLDEKKKLDDINNNLFNKYS